MRDPLLHEHGMSINLDLYSAVFPEELTRTWGFMQEQALVPLVLHIRPVHGSGQQLT